MPSELRQAKEDHHGRGLPEDIAASIRKDNDEIVGYRVRWREEDENGIERRPSKSFSTRDHGSLDAALAGACSYKEGVDAILRIEKSIARPDPWAGHTMNDVFQEWIVYHAPEVSFEYAQGVVKRWGKHVEGRPLARMTLERLSIDHGAFSRFQDELIEDELKAWLRYELLKDLRAVYRWGRRRHPAAMRVEVNGLIELPRIKRRRLVYAADAITLERLIQSVLNRPARDDLLPLRDAAFVAAMGFTIATRPSEWRLSAEWDSLSPPATSGGLASVLLQKAVNDDEEEDEEYALQGLKSGAHVALMVENAYDRIGMYRAAVESRFGPQPGNGLIFQVMDPEDGPIWVQDADGGPRVPLAMTKNYYNQWVKRVFVPAREAAAEAPDTPPGVANMTFYDCRHTAISTALHSTLVMGQHGMNLHALASWAGHDIATLERHYRHIIARYLGADPIVIEEECRRARRQVEADPFISDAWAGPQRDAQQRRRKRQAAGAIQSTVSKGRVPIAA